MAILNKPTLGTPRKAWQYHACQMTVSLLLREFDDASYYKAAVDSWERESNEFLRNAAGKRGASSQNITIFTDYSNRAKNIKHDDYHELNSQSFINMWSAFEAGIDNILADFILNDEDLKSKVKDFLKIQNSLADFDYDDCLVLSGRLHNKFKRSQSFTGRLLEVFEFADLPLDLKEIPALDEAQAMRNIVLHRYGEVRKQDADKFPAFAQWVGKVRPISRAMLMDYFSAMKNFLMAIFQAVIVSRYVEATS